MPPEPNTVPLINSAWSVLNEQVHSPWKRGQQVTPNRGIVPLFDSPAALDAFLDTLDFMTIQRAWERKTATLRVVEMPPPDEDDDAT